MDSIFGPGQSATGKHLLVEQVGQCGADHLSSAKSHHVVGVDSGKGIREGPPDRPRGVGKGSGGGKPVRRPDIGGHSSRDFFFGRQKDHQKKPESREDFTDEDIGSGSRFFGKVHGINSKQVVGEHHAANGSGYLQSDETRTGLDRDFSLEAEHKRNHRVEMGAERLQ